MRKKLKEFLSNYKKQVVILGVFLLSLAIFFIGKSFAVLTPIKSIILTSKNTSYEEKVPGSWQVEKSGKWISKGRARVTFDVDTTLMAEDKNTDIIMALDISGSMSGNKLDRVKQDSIELVDKLLSDSNNNVALITFNTSSTIVSNFTNQKDTLINQINSLQGNGSTNYYQALVNVDAILKNYTKQDDRQIIVLFLTGGYPNVDIPNQIGQYQYLKKVYPYVTINGIQYEMGSTILKPIKEISDNQFIADRETLNNVLFDASVAPMEYEEFQIVDYIDNRYFTLNSEDDITVSQGTVKLEEENGKQKITWNIDNFNSGRDAKLTMDIDLKEEYVGKGGTYSTNEKEQVISKIKNQEEDVSSTETPILSNEYKVIYDGNAPDGCSVENVPSTNSHLVFDTVEISSEVLSCEGYQFKGWEISNKDITKVNDDYFIMPEEDVIIRATWSKMKLAKSMDGTISKVQTLYKIMQDQAVLDNVKSEFVSSSSGINFRNAPSNTNGKGVYTRAGTENDKYPIYYYRGEVDNNHVKFANFCWKAVITTSTGGVKLIYDGVPNSNGACNNTGTASQIGTSAFSTNWRSPADVGYMYGTSRYTPLNKSMGEVNWYVLANKTRLGSSGMSNTNYYYGDSVTYANGVYTLTNPKQYAWSSNNNSIKGKYTCFSETGSSCAEVNYVDVVYSSHLAYVKMTGGETYDSITEQLRNITWIYGNDVHWDGSKYTLVDTVKSSPINWNTDRTSKIGAGHRYTCLSTESSCSTVYYVHYTGEPSWGGYMTLNNGKNIDDILNEMFPDDNDLRNQTDSAIKITIDTWYQQHMLDYTKYLEDTIWCNDRSIYQKNSWDKDYSGTGDLNFGAYGRNKYTYNPSVTCPNKNDSFTVSSEKGNGKLTYPVALLTADEATLAGNGDSGYSKDAYLYTGKYWWLLSPYRFSTISADVFYVHSSGALKSYLPNSTYGVRPSISLAPGVAVISGDGTSQAPYELDLQ